MELNTYMLQKSWHKLAMVQEVQDSIIIDGEPLYDTAFRVLCIIGFHPDITLASIHKHPYFKNYSHSTIKRALKYLQGQELVVSDNAGDDKREFLLRVAE